MIRHVFLAIALITTGCAATADGATATSDQNFDEESGEKPPLAAADLRKDAENQWRARHDADWIRADSFLVYQLNGDAPVVGNEETETMKVDAPDGIAAFVKFEIAPGFMFRTQTSKESFPIGGAEDPEVGSYPCADFKGTLELTTPDGAKLSSDPAKCTMTIDGVYVDRPDFPVSLTMKPRKIYTGTIVATLGTNDLRAGFVMVQKFY